MERNCPTLPTFWLPHQLICQDSDSNYNVQGRFWVWEPLFMWLMWQICSRTLDGRQFIKSTLFWLLQNNVLHTIVVFFYVSIKDFCFFLSVKFTQHSSFPSHWVNELWSWCNEELHSHQGHLADMKMTLMFFFHQPLAIFLVVFLQRILREGWWE